MGRGGGEGGGGCQVKFYPYKRGRGVEKALAMLKRGAERLEVVLTSCT